MKPIISFLCLLGLCHAAFGQRRNTLTGELDKLECYTEYGGCSCRDISFVMEEVVGTIPEAISECQLLEGLTIKANAISGTIPTILGSLSLLKILDLGSNVLQGSIPTELGLLSQLRILSLERNNLDGPIPASLSNCV
eukprot:6934084-Pyramimonas_sp.AAC.1